MKHKDALAQLARETERAKKSLSYERSLRVGFWFYMALASWTTIALLGLHERLPLVLQSLTAAAMLALLGWLAWRTVRAWTPPTDDEARARLAADSKLDAGAFESLRDRPSKFDAFSVALWRREQEQACARAAKARAGPPRPRLADKDRYGLRYIVLAAFVLVWIFAGGDRSDRLARAFLPDPGPLVGDGPLSVEAWATPAPYTHAAPVSLSDRLNETVETPPSVEATVRVTGPTGAPRLVFEGDNARRTAEFRRAADGAWEARMQIPGEGRLKIVRFHTRAAWTVQPARDNPPEAQLTAPLAALADERVTLGWAARDDYGLSRMALRVRPLNPPKGLIGADAIDTPLESPAGDPREASSEADIDLAPHPYAGMEVEAQVVAFDALGQGGVSETVRFIMPEKVFLQPLARAAIEIRRQVLSERRPYRGEGERTEVRTIPAGDILLGRQRIEIRDDARRPNLARAPGGIQRSVTLLDALTMEPRDGYFRDLAVFLGLRRARSELAAADAIDDTTVAADILWQTALRAEYGGAGDTRRTLEQAQQALADALRSGAPQERIRQLVEALRRATEAYLQSLVQEALRNGGPQTMEDTQDQTEISEQDIEDLLRQVERLNEQGRTQEAQALLQAFAGMLANLDARLDQSDGGEGGQGQQDRQMQQSMDDLANTIGEQRALRDDVEQQQQNPQQQQQSQQQQNSQGGSGGSQQGGEGGDQLAQRQSQIRQGLSQAQRMAGEAGAEPSQALNQAGQAMRQSEDALRRGDLQGARAAQDAALQRLRQGADELAAQIRDRRAGQGRQGGANGPRDPLGRLAPSGANGDGGETAVPTELDPARAREIFDEIRRRAQDPNRPAAEREYLRRLLERFSDGS